MAGVTDKDTGYGALLKGVKKLAKKPQILVGVRADATPAAGDDEDEDYDLLAVATVNEFGSKDGHIPERSFIRSTVDTNRRAYFKTLRRITVAAIEGRMVPRLGLDRLALLVVSDIQRKINTGPFKANADSTVKRKKSSRPLIEDGRLKQSIEATAVVGVRGET